VSLSSLRVLVVGDPEDGRGPLPAVAAALEQAGFSVRVAAGDEPPGAVAATFRPDVAVLAGPTADGSIAAARRMLERDHGVPVLLVEQEVGPSAAPSRDGDGHGADSIRVAPAPAPAAGLADLAEALARTGGGSSSTLAVGDIVVDLAGRLALRNDVPLPLTQREFDLLAYLVRNRNRVVAREALLSSVWNNEAVTPNAIEALISKLRTKLEAAGPRVIHTVRGIGYVLRIDGTSPFDLRRQAIVHDRQRMVQARAEILARRDQLREAREERAARHGVPHPDVAPPRP
jgi:DNA-binding response OmpR family regulator